MFHSINDVLADAHLRAASNSFAPSVVLKCKGPALFRSQKARNLACYFDLSPDVLIWSCMPILFGSTQTFHIPDFAVQRVDGDYLWESLLRFIRSPTFRTRQRTSVNGVSS